MAFLTSATVILVIVLLGRMMVNQYLIYSETLTLYKLQDEATQAQGELQKRRTASGAAELDGIKQQIAKVKKEIESYNSVIDKLQSGQFGNLHGPTQIMRALSAAFYPGVWLSDISISANSLSLQGQSMGHESLLKYVDKLNDQVRDLNIQLTSLEIDQENTQMQDAALGTMIKFKLR